MKKLIFIIIALLLISCNKGDDCFDVQYGTPFIAEAETDYCFSDGNEMRIDSIINAFCPCEAICVWQGQMEIYMTWTIDGSTYNFKHNSEAIHLDTINDLPISLNVASDNIVFEVPCILSNPSPEITSTELIINVN